MMKLFSDFLNRIANWKSLLISLAVYIFFAGVVLKNAENKINELAGKPIGVIDLTFGFDLQRSLSMVAEYGNAAREYYAVIEMTADILYPLVYAFLFAVVLTMLYRNKSYAWINRLPLLIVLFDYIENINIIILLKTYPEQPMIIASLCEIFKLLKWLGVGLVALLILLGLVSKLVKTNK